MSTTPGGPSTLVHHLATLLRNNGDRVLDGSSTLTLQVSHLQYLTSLFEQHLISRTHQHGFLALPSHPADTASLLQVQFLFDMLQKTLSLKLVNPPGTRLLSVVKIFPFKSLRRLELKRIPPHCLEGLRGVYSQLEIFICSKSLTSLEELLSLCGGDLSSALPWLELHTLNFSYNSITCLDQSLSLLNILKSLDLSHNKIQDCADYLKPLSELEHLNLAYNSLQRAPQLGLSATLKLRLLILRNNELETVHGLEHLSSLQHLDVAYNLLLEHSLLTPLSVMHSLQTLILEGNPLFFQKHHRSSTIRHLSPRAAFQHFLLDGCPFSTSELASRPKPGQMLVPSSQANIPVPAPIPAARERGSLELSSGGGELSDSLSVNEAVVVSRPRKKRSKGKIKVRRASISEPSDTDHNLKAGPIIQDIVLHHQKDIERMDSFREQLGKDWLRYQHHLETPTLTTSAPSASTPKPKPAAEDAGFWNPSSTTTTNPITSTGLHNGRLTPPSHQEPSPDRTAPPEDTLGGCSSPLFPPLPGDESQGAEMRTESTLQWGDHSQDSRGSSTLEKSGPDGDSALFTHQQQQEVQEAQQAHEDQEEGLEEDDQGVDLCLPLLVGIVTEGEERSKASGLESGPLPQGLPVFLRVRQGLLLEVDMQRGSVTQRVELDNLLRITSTQAIWGEEGQDVKLPAVRLHFNFIQRERRQRCYIMLDDNPQQAMQDLLDILSRVVEENTQHMEASRPRALQLQCLRCRAEFSQPWPLGPVRDPNRIDTSHGPQRGSVEERLEEEGGQQEIHGVENTRVKSTNHSNGSELICPECNSDHVIQLSTQLAPTTSTPVASDVEDGDDKRFFSFDDTDKPKRTAASVRKSHSEDSLTGCRRLTREATKVSGDPSESFLSATSALSRDERPDEDYGCAEQSISQPVSFHTADGGDGGTDLSTTTESQEEQELAGSYSYKLQELQQLQLEAQVCTSEKPSLSESPQAHFDLLSEDFDAVDHRLKLFLDVEVFEGEEELHSFLKMSTVKFGEPLEFPSLLVVSDQCIYILEITCEAQGQPSDWMQKRYRHRLCELSYVEVGLGSQSIHMEFADGGAAYTLLVRDSGRCKRFFSQLTGIVRELAPRSDSKLRGISTSRLTPHHHLWPLVCADTESSEEEGPTPQFLYVLAFLRQDHTLKPVTVLITRETLYLVIEDHQWNKLQLADASTNQEEDSHCGRADIQESQPISCVSSLHLFLSNPHRVDIKLYDEVLKQERTWALQTECVELVQELVEWVRTQWEAMFGVKLTTSTQE